MLKHYFIIHSWDFDLFNEEAIPILHNCTILARNESEARLAAKLAKMQYVDVVQAEEELEEGEEWKKDLKVRDTYILQNHLSN